MAKEDPNKKVFNLYMLAFKIALFRQDSGDEDVLHVDEGGLQRGLEQAVWHCSRKDVPVVANFIKTFLDEIYIFYRKLHNDTIFKPKYTQ